MSVNNDVVFRLGNSGNLSDCNLLYGMGGNINNEIPCLKLLKFPRRHGFPAFSEGFGLCFDFLAAVFKHSTWRTSVFERIESDVLFIGERDQPFF